MPSSSKNVNWQKLSNEDSDFQVMIISKNKLDPLRI
jgi:hypothetical protein